VNRLQSLSKPTVWAHRPLPRHQVGTFSDRPLARPCCPVNALQPPRSAQARSTVTLQPRSSKDKPHQSQQTGLQRASPAQPSERRRLQPSHLAAGAQSSDTPFGGASLSDSAAPQPRGPSPWPLGGPWPTWGCRGSSAARPSGVVTPASSLGVPLSLSAPAAVAAAAALTEYQSFLTDLRT
jgi:hypothetical protein